MGGVGYGTVGTILSAVAVVIGIIIFLFAYGVAQAMAPIIGIVLAVAAGIAGLSAGIAYRRTKGTGLWFWHIFDQVGSRYA